MKSVLMVILATLVGASASAQTLFKDSGSSSIQVDPVAGSEGYLTTITETRYIQVGYPSENLLKAVITSKTQSGAEGLWGTSKLEMRTTVKNKWDKVLWTAQEEGTEVKLVTEELVGVIQYGCCAAPDITRLLNVDTGRKVEAAAGKIFKIDVPNANRGKRRYLSLALDSKAAPTVSGKTYIGTVSYYSAEKIISRVRIYADLPQGWGTDIYDLKVSGLALNSKLEVNGDDNVTLWDTNGVNGAAGFGGFALTGKLAYDKQEESFRIAFANDTVDKNPSEATPGLHLEFVK